MSPNLGAVIVQICHSAAASQFLDQCFPSFPSNDVAQALGAWPTKQYKEYVRCKRPSIIRMSRRLVAWCHLFSHRVKQKRSLRRLQISLARATTTNISRAIDRNILVSSLENKVNALRNVLLQAWSQGSIPATRRCSADLKALRCLGGGCPGHPTFRPHSKETRPRTRRSARARRRRAVLVSCIHQVRPFERLGS